MAFSDVTAVIKHFSQANEGFTATLGSSIAASAVTIPLSSVSGLDDGSVFVGIIEPGGAKEQAFMGVVDAGGVQLTGVVWTKGSDVPHSLGVTIVDYVTGAAHNMMTKGILVAHNQDGTLKTGVNLTSPKITTSLNDTNNNELIKVAATSSAVNEVTVTNAATGNNPSVAASGGDTNIGLNLVPKGTGEVQLNGVNVSGAWQSWTPSYTNITLGAGTVIAEYKQVGKTVTFRYVLTFAANTSISSSNSISLPVTASANAVAQVQFTGIGGLKDATTGGHQAGVVALLTTTTMRPVFINTNGAYEDLTATVPFTWAVADQIKLTGTYEAA